MLRRLRMGLTLNSFWHRLRVRWSGCADGKAGHPAIDQKEPAIYETRLLDLGKQVIEAIHRQFGARTQSLEATREAQIQSLRKAVKEFEDVDRAYRTLRSNLGRDLEVQVRHGWYVFFVITIVIGEAALNFQAFEVFQKPFFMTLIMAAAVGVSIPICAHFLGIWVRQWPSPWPATLLKVAIVAAVGAAAVFGINIARSEYLKLLEMDLGPADQAIQRAFVAMNAFVFVTAIVLSHFAHDPDPQLEASYHKMRLWDSRCHRLAAAIQDVSGKLDSLAYQQRAEINIAQAVTSEVVRLYRHANLRARAERALPESFKVDPLIPEAERAHDLQTRTSEKTVADLLARWHGDAAHTGT